MVKDLVMMTDYGQIKQVISTLEHEFTLSSNPNSRKGGLVGLAATAIALGRVRVKEREREHILCFRTLTHKLPLYRHRLV